MTEKKEFFYFIDIREHTSGNSDVFSDGIICSAYWVRINSYLQIIKKQFYCIAEHKT
jgi:hypothetical protein